MQFPSYSNQERIVQNVCKFSKCEGDVQTTGNFNVPGSSDGPANVMIFTNDQFERFQFVSREKCLARAKSNVQLFTRNCEEYFLHSSAISCTGSVA